MQDIVLKKFELSEEAAPTLMPSSFLLQLFFFFFFTLVTGPRRSLSLKPVIQESMSLKYVFQRK